ncbi:site-specific integrase [Carboxylicivirga marina]|uniref:Site-specific integrase n=1 Tax=Carboxylicivirga marina TaxID=2800988 RepID=A0ABS1HKS5_9BACT|nr:site-specific integrase [Carboxylicivirga marina]MBK3518246.1 site-specific integrase [Carboxylicivirga marina]
MSNQQTFAVLFFFRAKRNNKSYGTIYIRVTANGLRTDFTSNLDCKKTEWDSKKGHFKGTSVESKTNNLMLEQVKAKLISIFQQERLMDDFLTPQVIRQKFIGDEQENYSLRELIEYHLDSHQDTLEPCTLKYYRTTRNYLYAFLEKRKNIHDISLSKIDFRFLTDFEAFLWQYQPLDLGVRKLAHNTIMKHLAHLRTIINLAIKLGWMEKYPFKSYKISYKQSKRTYLTMYELQRIENKRFTFDRLQLTKDLFIFSCYTGLAYSDIKLLTKDSVIIGIDGGNWINSSRKKTDTILQIPLLPVAAELVHKYEDHPVSQVKNKLFPVPSNQKINAYLKEIAEICEIKKHLTFHMARHTFATTITLSNGVPIETVSKVLGHNRIATTQIYAKVLENKISQDMMELRTKLNVNTENSIVSTTKIKLS